MIELIPAIDLINGQCVRLTKGDYDRRRFTMTILPRLQNSLSRWASNAFM